MDEQLQNLELKAKRLYEERRFRDVEDLFTAFITTCDRGKDALVLAKALNNRGHAKYMQVEFDEALHDYNEAIGVCHDLAVTFYNRATVKYRMGHFQAAISDFETACRLDPSNDEFQQGLTAGREALRKEAK